VELHLKGLRPEETAELVAASGRSTDAAEIAVLHDRTDGNPFFVQQLVQFLGEDPDRRADAVIPTGVRHVIANRLQLLPTSTRQVLEAAAVAGRAFDTRLVATIVGRSTAETMDDLDLAFEHELIEPDDPSAQRHRFVHALIQETLREGLSPMMGARLHAATAEALESARDAAPAELAEHLWLAGDLAPAGATVKALVVAADAATPSLAHEQAELLLRRALRVLVAGPSEDIDAEVDVRSRLLNLLTATTGWSSADLPMIADRVLQLVDEIGLRPDLLPLWHLLWTGFTARGDMERSREVATELRHRAEAVGDALFVHTADLLLGYLDTQAGDDLPATLDRIILAREGLDRQPDAHLAATPEHMGVTARLIEVNARGFLDGADATADAEQLIAYAEQVGRPFSRMAAYLFAGDAAVLQGKAASAADWTQRGLDLCKRHGFAGAHHLLVPANAWARVQLGANVSEQAGRVAESLSAIEADRGQVTAKYLLVHAALLGRAGDPDGARDRLGRARQWVAATGEHVYDPIIDRAEAALAG